MPDRIGMTVMIGHGKIASGLFPYIWYAVTDGVGAVLPPFPAKTYSQVLKQTDRQTADIDCTRIDGSRLQQQS